jgi:ribosome-associated protein
LRAKSRRDHSVDGDSAAAGNDADGQSGNELPDTETPSRTERKNASEQLQKVGEKLLTLRADLLAGLSLPDRLREAVLEAKRMTSFGAKRRQTRLIGKLMRQLDRETLEAVYAALRVE